MIGFRIEKSRLSALLKFYKHLKSYKKGLEKQDESKQTNQSAPYQLKSKTLKSTGDLSAVLFFINENNPAMNWA